MKKLFYLLMSLSLGMATVSCSDEKTNEDETNKIREGSRTYMGVAENGDSIYLVDLGLKSGTLWADRNIGADKIEDFGDYYAWGEVTTKEEYSKDTYLYYEGKVKEQGNSDVYYDKFKDIGNDISGNEEYDAVAKIWGKKYMMPTREQCMELVYSCTWEWITLNGINGVKGTGPNGYSIFIPAGGAKGKYTGYSNVGESESVGTQGYIWSSTVESPEYCYNIDFSKYSSSFSINATYNYSSYAIRYTGRNERAVASLDVIK